MTDYKEFTFGWMIFGVIIPIHLLMTFLYLNGIGDQPMDTNSYIAVTVVLLIVCLLFYGLTTEVTSQAVIVSFGIGLIRKRIPFTRISGVEVVTTPWYYGWGIRIIPNGTLYNISGRHGVELTLNDTSRIIRIGTRNSSNLKQEIDKRRK